MPSTVTFLLSPALASFTSGSGGLLPVHGIAAKAWIPGKGGLAEIQRCVGGAIVYLILSFYTFDDQRAFFAHTNGLAQRFIAARIGWQRQSGGKGLGGFGGAEIAWDFWRPDKGFVPGFLDHTVFGGVGDRKGIAEPQLFLA